MDCFSPDSSSMDGDLCPDGGNNGGRVRQRLRPWLEAQINSGRFPGLAWVNQEEGIFRITWKHGGRADWSEQDALIFKEWAIHTGRFREGTDPNDYPAWKTRLRCALNKLPDIQEQKQLSCYDEPNPYRVYRFVDRKGGEPVSPSYRHTTSPENSFHANQIISQPVTRPSVIQANIPTIITEVTHTVPDSSHPKADLVSQGVAGVADPQISSLGSDLGNIDIRDLVPLDDTSPSLTNISYDSHLNSAEPMDTGSGSLRNESGVYQHATLGAPGSTAPLLTQIKEEKEVLYLPPLIPLDEMVVTIRFRQRVIEEKRVFCKYGCRVYFGSLPCDRLMPWQQEIFGEPEADQIPIPYIPGKLDQMQDAFTMKLLKALERGISIFMSHGAIYVLRRCKTSVFTAPPHMEGKGVVKIERQQEPVMIFDYFNYFRPALDQFHKGLGPRPSTQVILALGQSFNPTCEPYTNLLISVTVSHSQAYRDMDQLLTDYGAPVEISHSDEYDRFLSVTRHQHFNFGWQPAAEAGLS